MIWRDQLHRTTIWLNPSGYDHVSVALTRVGPVFCVDDNGQNSYESWGGRKTWHLTYDGAVREYKDRLELVEAENSTID